MYYIALQANFGNHCYSWRGMVARAGPRSIGPKKQQLVPKIRSLNYCIPNILNHKLEQLWYIVL